MSISVLTMSNQHTIRNQSGKCPFAPRQPHIERARGGKWQYHPAWTAVYA